MLGKVHYQSSFNGKLLTNNEHIIIITHFKIK